MLDVHERVLVPLQEAGARVGLSWVTVRNWAAAGHVEAFFVAGKRQRHAEAEQVETWALMR